MKAYLDIETSFGGDITVVGVYARDRGMIQLVGGRISDVAVWHILEGVETICTYNGTRFDLPVIRRRLGLDLAGRFRSHDLMYDCWRSGLFGGLKRVEERLGILRRLKGIDGRDAMRLWSRYEDDDDERALELLLGYNREDVLNLPVLEARLRGVGERDAGRD
jgi:uncharacterized protein YprB with RNaseH-like and TPR domain